MSSGGKGGSCLRHISSTFAICIILILCMFVCVCLLCMVCLWLFECVLFRSCLLFMCFFKQNTQQTTKTSFERLHHLGLQGLDRAQPSRRHPGVVAEAVILGGHAARPHPPSNCIKQRYIGLIKCNNLLNTHKTELISHCNLPLTNLSNLTSGGGLSICVWTL